MIKRDERQFDADRATALKAELGDKYGPLTVEWSLTSPAHYYLRIGTARGGALLIHTEGQLADFLAREAVIHARSCFLFAGTTGGETGGMGDYLGRYDSAEAAQAELEQIGGPNEIDWAHAAVLNHRGELEVVARWVVDGDGAQLDQGEGGR